MQNRNMLDCSGSLRLVFMDRVPQKVPFRSIRNGNSLSAHRGGGGGGQTQVAHREGNVVPHRGGVNLQPVTAVCSDLWQPWARAR